MKKLLTSTALMFGALAGVAYGQLVTPGGASGTIQYSVAVCNPNSPFRCVAPDASGNVPVTISAGSAVIGAISNTSFLSPVNGVATNPTSTLTLPSTTTAYSAGNLIANSATAGSVVVPSFAIANSAGGAIISRLRLSSNDSTATAWGAQTITVDLWTAAPTFTNGDRGAYSPATGTANHIGSYTCVMSAVYGSGVYGECYTNVGNFSLVKLASGTAVYWTLTASTGSGVTGASKVFTLTAEVLN